MLKISRPTAEDLKKRSGGEGPPQDPTHVEREKAALQNNARPAIQILREINLKVCEQLGVVSELQTLKECERYIADLLEWKAKLAEERPSARPILVESIDFIQRILPFASRGIRIPEECFYILNPGAYNKRIEEESLRINQSILELEGALYDLVEEEDEGKFVEAVKPKAMAFISSVENFILLYQEIRDRIVQEKDALERLTKKNMDTQRILMELIKGNLTQ